MTDKTATCTNTPLVNSREIKIEFGDCDPAGIVYFPNYFRMFDNCTAGLFEAALGKTKPDWVKSFGILGIPMVDTGAKFLRPSTYGDRVHVESRATAIGRSSIKIEHKLYNNGQLAVDGWEVRVWVKGTAGEPDSIHAVEVPVEVRQALGF